MKNLIVAGSRDMFIRNCEMAEVATHLLAFWDSKSKGTKHMIDISKKKGLRIKIIYYLG